MNTSSVLYFQVRDVKKILDHSKQSSEWNTPYSFSDVEPQPGLFWVKDAGTYLMSNGRPGLLRENSEGHVVVYALGYGPDCDWGVLQSVCGGDDFVEMIPSDAIDPLIEVANDDDAISIAVSETSFEIGLARRVTQ